jgi:hypothetical protein
VKYKKLKPGEAFLDVLEEDDKIQGPSGTVYRVRDTNEVFAVCDIVSSDVQIPGGMATLRFDKFAIERFSIYDVG